MSENKDKNDQQQQKQGPNEADEERKIYEIIKKWTLGDGITKALNILPDNEQEFTFDNKIEVKEVKAYFKIFKRGNRNRRF